MVDGGGGGYGSSLGLGEVNGGDLLHPQRKLVSVYLSQLGVEGCLLTSKLVVVLSNPQLGVDLSSVGSCILFLLVSLLLIVEELHSWMGYHGLHRDRQDGLESRSVLQRYCSGDGVSQGHHIAPLGAG
jgi:hypothetical protein